MSKIISKKLRFEVFKRDKFKCQYCGRGSPEVMLEIRGLEADHVLPVCEGGETNILNLVTACFDCNRGKSGTLLSDDTALSKQRKQLEELEERRQQIELMMEWYKSLQNVDNLKLQKITEHWNKIFNPYKLTEIGEKDMGKIIKKYELLEVLVAIDETFEYYNKRGIEQFQKEKKWFIRDDQPIIDILSKAKRLSKLDNGDNILEIQNKISYLKNEIIELKTSKEKLLASFEKGQITRKITKKEYEISSLEDKLASFNFEKEQENQLEKLLLKQETFNSPTGHLKYTFMLLLDKLPGILKNKRREREDPNYKFILEIYRKIKPAIKNSNWEFNFKFVEKLYDKLRSNGFSYENCVSIMTSNNWEYIQDLIDFVDTKIDNIQLSP